jgi:hypothetical protein
MFNQLLAVDPVVNLSVTVTQKATAMFVLDGVASRVVEAFNKVLSSPRRLPSHLREPVMEWLSLMPGFIMDSREALALIQRKQDTPFT